MEFEGIVNARDLGGIRIGNRTVRYGRLLRTAHLHDATDADVEKMISDFKVDSSKIIIDSELPDPEMFDDESDYVW